MAIYLPSHLQGQRKTRLINVEETENPEMHCNNATRTPRHVLLNNKANVEIATNY